MSGTKFLGVVGVPVPLYPTGGAVPVQVDTQGRLIVVGGGGGGSSIVEGTATPSDAFANPTNAVTAWALGGGWDGSNWERMASDGSGHQLTIGAAPSVANLSGVAGFSTISGALTREVVAASSARLLAIDFALTTDTSGLYLMFFNDDAAPNNGDTAVLSFALADTQFIVKQLGREFFGEAGKAFPTGISWGISTTPSTLTVIGAGLQGNLNVSFVI